MTDPGKSRRRNVTTLDDYPTDDDRRFRRQASPRLQAGAKVSPLRAAMIFYAITLALTLGAHLLVPYLGEATAMVTMLMPAIATVLMLTLIAREGNLREMLGALGVMRLGLRAWPLAVIGPVLILFAGLALLVGLGLTELVGMSGSTPVGQIALGLLASLAVGMVLALTEEVGWRGYMLPRMAVIGLVPSMLAVGFLQGVWHLPLILTTDYYHSTGNPWIVTPLFLFTLTLAGVFYGYLRVWSGSIWPVALAHCAVNFSWNITKELSHTQSPIVLEYVGGESGVVMIVGLLVADLLLLRMLRRKMEKGAVQ